MATKPVKTDPHAEKVSAVAAILIALNGLDWVERRRVLIAACVLNADETLAAALSATR